MRKIFMSLIFTITCALSMEDDKNNFMYEVRYEQACRFYDQAAESAKNHKLLSVSLKLLEKSALLGHVDAPYDLMMYHYRLMCGNLPLVTFELACESPNFEEGGKWQDLLNENVRLRKKYLSNGDIWLLLNYNPNLSSRLENTPVRNRKESRNIF